MPKCGKVNELTDRQVNELLVLLNVVASRRDRRPRLSAPRPFINTRWVTSPPKEAWRGFYCLDSGGQTRASVPTLRHLFQTM